MTARGSSSQARSEPVARDPRPSAVEPEARDPALEPHELQDSRPGPDTLVHQYAAMAHAFEARPVDAMLRGLDLVIGSIALIVALPLCVVIAVALRLSSPRSPSLYRGQRVGQAGELFKMLKFRTLIPDAEQRLGPYLGAELTHLTATEVTRMGRILRASKLDELPQLYNVLRGEMSLVGPRPIRPAFFAELCQEIPQYWQRLVVRPGITGLAQLRMTREMTWAEKLAHDLEYIADRSFNLYMSVIFTTVWLMVFRPANRRSTLNRLP